MEVILLEKIHNLGDLGQTIKVKPGFGRNYLVPQGKAIYATKANLEVFEQRRSELEAKAAEVLKEAQDLAKQLEKLDITMNVQVGPQGKLYGAVTNHEVMALVNKQGFEINKRQLHLSVPVIRSLGEYTASIQLHPDVVVEIPVKVVDPTGEYTSADVPVEEAKEETKPVEAVEAAAEEVTEVEAAEVEAEADTNTEEEADKS